MGIFGITCLLVLANYVLGKPVNHLLKNIGDVNWKEKTGELWGKLRPYAKKAGRATAKPVLTLCHVLKDGDLSTSEKVTDKIRFKVEETLNEWFCDGTFAVVFE